MHYYSYDLPRAVTEERLASIVTEGVKDYLSEVTYYVKHCQKTIAEKDEIIDCLTSDNEALSRRVAELEQCLATCHAMGSKAMTFGGAVGTVVAVVLAYCKLPLIVVSLCAAASALGMSFLL